TTAILRTPGNYDVSFFLDAPRIIHCFSLTVNEDPEMAKQRALEHFGSLTIDYSNTYNLVPAKEEIKLNFKLNDLQTQEPLKGLKDVQVMWTVASRQVHQRVNAFETSEDGTYEVSLTLPDQGIYYLYVQCRSRNFSFDNPQYYVINAVNQ
ncbi:MAG: hypothetical protein JKY54_06730, partial [Flavobacteriales bacterium]|nr:hypothetical protein [Flavobacteriales bacterium]